MASPPVDRAPARLRLHLYSWGFRYLCHNAPFVHPLTTAALTPGYGKRPGCHRPIVNPQQTAEFTPGQGKKDEKGGPFRECTNRRDIYDGRVSERSLGLADLVSRAWRLYRPRAPLLVPTFLAVFIVLRELLLVVLVIDLPDLTLLLVVTLVQAVVPAFVGSLLIAATVPVLATDTYRGLRDSWASLSAHRHAVYRCAAWSAGLALFAAITLGPVGIIVQPMLLGAPLLVHEVTLHRRGFEAAMDRTKQMISRDTRSLAYMLIVPAAVGLLVSITLRTFGVLSGDVPGVARGIVYFALQGALIGMALPYVAAVALLCYWDLASTLGGEEAR
jgi:hypothetical protein